MKVTRLSKRFALIVLLPTLLLTGCAKNSPQYVPVPHVSCPVLPPSALQIDKPSWCSPSCTSALTVERENSVRRLMNLTQED